MKRMILFVLCFCLSLLLCSCTKVSVKENAPVYLVYNYNDVSVNTQLSEDQAQKILHILDKKRLFSDDPSCGFNEEISFKIEGKTYAPACDDCGLIKECSSGKYMNISKTERDIVEEIFLAYGGHFPCV